MSKQSAMALNLIFLGPPGAGKGTQAKMIEEKYNIPQISTGNLMRKEVALGSSIGKDIDKYIKGGGLVPDDIVIAMLLKTLESEECQNGYILDGFPRTVEQAKGLEEALVKNGTPLIGTIAIAVNDEDLVKRLGGRRVCLACGGSFHMEHNKPKVEGVCDHCQGELVLRSDDNAEVIANRLKVYHEQTAPLIKFYAEQNKMHLVDGNKKIEMIFQEICGIIDALI
jgi:adenylate kinase